MQHTLPTTFQQTYTTSQAANMLGVHRSSVIRWTNEGLMHCGRLPSGHRRYTYAQLLEMFNRINWQEMSQVEAPASDV